MVTLSDQEYQQLQETISQLKKEVALLRREKTSYNIKEKTNLKRSVSGSKAKIADRLFGILSIPDAIEYKDILADELVRKYLKQ